MMRLGFVGGGIGSMAGPLHRHAARLDGRYQLLAGALSTSPERSLRSAAEAGIPRAYADHTSLIRGEKGRKDGVEAVAVLTPNASHFPICRDLLQAGFHVLCDKPLCTRLEDALALAQLVEETGLRFGVTHNYSGYPMVRQAKAMIAAGDLGEIRRVQVEYAGAWLTELVEEQGHKQAGWRQDPELAGPAGCTGDIGVHAHHLLRFVTGVEPVALSAELRSLVPGRRLDDDVSVRLRLADGAVAHLWACQAAPGNRNRLRLRVFGSTGGLEWDQEEPEVLLFSPVGGTQRRLLRGDPGLDPVVEASSRLPAGHPEGFLEAFANLYRDFAEERPIPTVWDGVAGVEFIEQAVASSGQDGAWVELSAVPREG